MEQGTLNLGEQLRDDGIARALAHADDVTPTWATVAAGYLALFARRKTEFMAEDVRAHAESHGFAVPPDCRAWGKVVREAARAGLIVRTGYAPNKDPKCHCSPKSVWRGA